MAAPIFGIGFPVIDDLTNISNAGDLKRLILKQLI